MLLLNILIIRCTKEYLNTTTKKESTCVRVCCVALPLQVRDNKAREIARGCLSQAPQGAGSFLYTFNVHLLEKDNCTCVSTVW